MVRDRNLETYCNPFTRCTALSTVLTPPGFVETYDALLKRSRPGLVTLVLAPPVSTVSVNLRASYKRGTVSPIHGIGTIRFHQHGSDTRTTSSKRSTGG